MAIDLVKFQHDAYETSKAKQWHKNDELDRDGVPTARQKLSWTALITDELDEADIELDCGRFETYFEDGGKPCGVITEYADALVRIGDMCGACGWTLNNKAVVLTSIPAARNAFVEAVREGQLNKQERLINNLFWCIVSEFRTLRNYATTDLLFETAKVKMAYNKTRPERHGGKLA